jgi:hypothetical protein
MLLASIESMLRSGLDADDMAAVEQASPIFACLAGVLLRKSLLDFTKTPRNWEVIRSLDVKCDGTAKVLCVILQALKVFSIIDNASHAETLYMTSVVDPFMQKV